MRAKHLFINWGHQYRQGKGLAVRVAVAGGHRDARAFGGRGGMGYGWRETSDGTVNLVLDGQEVDTFRFGDGSALEREYLSGWMGLHRVTPAVGENCQCGMPDAHWRHEATAPAFEPRVERQPQAESQLSMEDPGQVTANLIAARQDIQAPPGLVLSTGSGSCGVRLLRWLAEAPWLVLWGVLIYHDGRWLWVALAGLVYLWLTSDFDVERIPGWVVVTGFLTVPLWGTGLLWLGSRW